MRFDKKKLPLAITFGAIFFISLFLKLALAVLRLINIYFYADIIFHKSEQLLLIVLMITSLSALILILVAKAKTKILSIGVCLFVLLVNLLSTGGLWDPEERYFVFTSPGNEHTLVVEECAWLLGGWSICYEKVSANFVRKIDVYISTNDGYRPFSAGDYSVNWQDNTAIITYGFGSGAIKNDVVVNFR